MLHGTIDHGSDVHVALCNAHTLCKYRSSVHRPIACLLIAKELIYFKRRMSSGTFGDVRGGSFDAKARLKEGGDIRGGISVSWLRFPVGAQLHLKALVRYYLNAHTNIAQIYVHVALCILVR